MNYSQEQPINDSILEKIKKLLEIREDRGATPAEVEAAAAMATRLLMRHNLSMKDVESHEFKEKNPITDDSFELNDWQSKTDGNWVLTLLNTICYYNLCKCVHIPSHIRYHQGKVMIFGKKENVESITYIVIQLINKIEIAYKATWKQYSLEEAGNPYAEKRNTFRRGYCLGVVQGIADRLAKDRMDMVAEIGRQYRPDGGVNPLLGMIKFNDKAIDVYIEEKIGETKNANSNAGKTRKAFESQELGYNDGYNMNVNKGLEHSKPKGHIN